MQGHKDFNVVGKVGSGSGICAIGYTTGKVKWKSYMGGFNSKDGGVPPFGAVAG